MSVRKILAACLFAALALSVSFAQENSRPEGIAFVRAKCETLVAGLYPEVLRDLKVPMEHWRSVSQRAGNGMRSYGTQWKWLDAQRDARDRLMASLTPPQRVRLEELTLQWEGALCAFLRPTIASKLNLTPEQDRRLQTILEIYQAGFPNAGLYTEHYRSNDGIDQLKLNKAADTIAESVLTVKQRLQWEQMRGKRLEPEPPDWRSAFQ